MTASQTELEKRLIARIGRDGRIAFRDFMEAALYDAEFGYYNTARRQIGAAGDFYTSSNVHPAFGAILAKAFVELWQPMRGKHPFALIEMGAGTGQLALDVLQALRAEHGDLFVEASYTIVEQSPVMRARQSEKLREFSDKVQWRDLSELVRQPIIGILFSNELVDAFPVHRLRVSNNGIEEQFVDLKPNLSKPATEIAKEKPAIDNDTHQQALTLVWQAAANAELYEYIRRTAVRFVENQVIEINLDAIRWLKTLAAAMSAGFLVTIDYGDVAAHLYSPERRAGTLRCFHRHTLTDTPLARIGEQDITASVNFSALMDYGNELGFDNVSYERQTNFLFRHGLIERIAAMEASGTMENLQDRLAIKNLLAPGGVSDNFRVLIQRKG